MTSRDHTARLQHAASLGEERIEVEPMQRLTHRDELCTRMGKAARVRRHCVLDPGMGRGLIDLCAARVSRNHPREAGDESVRHLPVPCPHIPRQLGARPYRRHPLEQRAWIPRSKRRVRRSVTGKVVSEGWLAYGAA